MFSLILLFSATELSAQKDEYEKPRDVKVISEQPDGKGNIVRTVQYNQGLMRVTEQIIMPQPGSGRILRLMAINPDTLIHDSLLVLIDKKRYAVQLYYRHRLIRNYRAVFGPRPMENKCMEGDRCTPEGSFTITNKNPKSQYNKFMLLSYPNDSARARFNRLKEKGSIPASAKIGGSIGIHGIWKGGDDMIQMGIGWTDGCIALMNKDIEELYSFVNVGTKVLIRK